MGLFDHVKCRVPLPDGYQGELQTKDFDDPYMVTHEITEGGRLMQAVILRVETVPKDERPYPNAADGDVLSFAGSMRTITEMRDVNYHGLFHFGGLEKVGEREPDERGRRFPIYASHDYVAKFTDGQLVGITIDQE